jgi:hypothetical protein
MEPFWILIFIAVMVFFTIIALYFLYNDKTRKRS